MTGLLRVLTLWMIRAGATEDSSGRLLDAQAQLEAAATRAERKAALRKVRDAWRASS